MIDIKMLKGTGPYNQMKRYIEDAHKDLNPQQRAGRFTALLKRYVVNQNDQRPRENNVPKNLLRSFIWDFTKEGSRFWVNISKFPEDLPVEQPPVKKEKVEEKPVVVWPEGYTHYNPKLNQGKGAFFNSAGRILDGGHRGWDHPLAAFEHWSKERSTIKRPENPLPRGLQWPDGATHFRPDIGGRFFNAEGQWVVGGLPGFHKFMGKTTYNQWLALGQTIKRYPDNQPLVLGAPVRPVGQRGDQPVPGPIPVPIAAAKAPVEPPKPVHKPIGWWN